MKINHFTKKLQRLCLRSRRTSSKAEVFIFLPFPCRISRRRRPLRRRCLRSLMSLKPVSIAFVWSICLFWASWNILAERSNLSLSCLILRFHISITAVWNSPAEDPLGSGSSRRRRFPLRQLFSAGLPSAFFLPEWVLEFEAGGLLSSAISLLSTNPPFCSVLVKMELPFNGHLCRIYAVAMPHYFVKIIKIWKAIFDDFYSSFSSPLSSLF